MRTTRRSVVTVSGLVALGSGGCSPDGSGTSSGPTSTSSTATASATPEQDPDLKAVDRALGLTTALLADLAASKPGVDAGGELAAIHEAHLAALGEAAPDAVPTTPATPSPRPLNPKALRRREVAAQRELARLGQSARSGAVARLLASMSAGIAAGLAAGGATRGALPR